MLLPVSAETLGDLDRGSARAIIDAAIADAARDLEDRGEDGKPRKVNITLTLTTMDNGDVAAHLEAAASVPKRRTASTVAGMKRDGQQVKLLFQTLAPEDPRQRTIDELEGAAT